MLKDWLVLIVICAILVGGAFWWSTQGSVKHLSAPAEQALNPEATATTPPSPPKTAPKPRSIPPPVVEQAAVPEPVPPPVIPEPAPVVPPPLPPPFPAVDQIANGAHEETITQKYGDPALSAVTSAGGHKVETLIYAKDHGRSATVIRFEDG